jgi:hypothetical protein
MIDAGDNVGLPFSGKAPDLGAFETGTVTGMQRGEELPLEFTLDQNFPNPFNPTTAISYQLSAHIFVTLKVLDVLGREVATLVTGEQTAGVHRVEFNGSALASGIYFARLQVGTLTKTIKMILTK